MSDEPTATVWTQVYVEMVDYLRDFDAADGTPILAGDQPEDVAFALAANVDLIERFAAFYGGTKGSYLGLDGERHEDTSEVGGAVYETVLRPAEEDES